MPRSNKLKDLILSQLDTDPVKAEAMYDNLSNDELIEHIASTCFTDFGYHRGHCTPLMDEDFNH